MLPLPRSRRERTAGLTAFAVPVQKNRGEETDDCQKSKRDAGERRRQEKMTGGGAGERRRCANSAPRVGANDTNELDQHDFCLLQNCFQSEENKLNF